MSYFLRHDESIGDGIRRVVRDEVESAITEIDDDDMARSEALHEVRKHCKKIRGALRLVRYSFEDYAGENIRYRDLARKLSAMRNAHILRDIQRELIGEVAKPASQADIAALDVCRKAETYRRAIRNLLERLANVGAQLRARSRPLRKRGA